MARIGLPPRRTMSTEYVSDLQPGPGHPGARSLQTSRQCLTLQFGQRFIGADRVSDRFGGDMCAFRDHPITGSDNIRSVIPI